jgi:hypothetical protein
MKAAAEVLQATGATLVNQEWWNPLETECFNYDKWEPFELVESKVKLKEGETPVEWWTKGAAIPNKAFERAMMTPWIFPNFVIAVDSWVRRPEEGGKAAVFAVIVTRQDEYHTIPVVTSSTASQARRMIGLKLNRIISDIVGIPLEYG